MLDMMNRRRFPRLVGITFAVSLVVAIATGSAHGADVKPLAIGSPAPDFNLPGVDGKQHTLSEYKDAKILAVVFTCNHCPTAQAYEQRLKQLVTDYRPKGVAFVANNPNSPAGVRLDELGYTDVGDECEDRKPRATQRGSTFP